MQLNFTHLPKTYMSSIRNTWLLHKRAGYTHNLLSESSMIPFAKLDPANPLKSKRLYVFIQYILVGSWNKLGTIFLSEKQ